jgi:hypothetical protein
VITLIDSRLICKYRTFCTELGGVPGLEETETGSIGLPTPQCFAAVVSSREVPSDYNSIWGGPSRQLQYQSSLLFDASATAAQQHVLRLFAL